ncbi:MAG: bifunctional folylpolyglutamate synthase/dihydrofolate synthase, partial [Candidatus Sumerlaeota bacterium]
MAPQRNNPEDKAYRQAVDDLLGLVNYEVKPPPMRFDTQGWHLEAFGRLLERLGKPQSAFPIIHVAGTKGKGSVTRMTAALLKAGGLGKVGIFTSPHIHSFRERIAINGRPISKGDFAGIFDKVRATQSGDNSEGFRTTFETLTAMALVYFKEQQCDAVVLETGLGGRLDATNVPCSEIAVITSIGYDHQKVLGDTLREIAGEKA